MSNFRSCSVKEFCARYGISQTTFYRRRAEMPRAILVGSQYRITEPAEREWLDGREIAALTEANRRAKRSTGASV